MLLFPGRREAAAEAAYTNAAKYQTAAPPVPSSWWEQSGVDPDVFKLPMPKASSGDGPSKENALLGMLMGGGSVLGMAGGAVGGAFGGPVGGMVGATLGQAAGVVGQGLFQSLVQPFGQPDLSSYAPASRASMDRSGSPEQIISLLAAMSNNSRRLLDDGITTKTARAGKL